MVKKVLIGLYWQIMRVLDHHPKKIRKYGAFTAFPEEYNFVKQWNYSLRGYNYYG